MKTPIESGEDMEARASRLLDTLYHNAERGEDNTRYLKYVLQAWYDSGYYDAISKIAAKEKYDD